MIFRKCHKKIMKDVISLKKSGKKHFEAGTIIGENLYYSNWNSKGLFRTNLVSSETGIIDVFESNILENSYNLAFSCGNQVWFIPRTLEENIAIYDINKENLEYLCIPRAKCLGQYELFKDYHIMGKSIWLIPYSYDAILKVDVDNKEVIRIENEVVSVIDSCWPTFIKSCKYKDKIYMCPWEYDRIGVFDTETLEISALDINIPKRTFRNILGFNEKIYLIPFEVSNGLLEYDLLTQRCNTITIEKNLVGKYSAAFIDKKNQELILFPYIGNEILIVNTHTWESDTIAIEVNGQELISNPYWVDVREMNNQVWVIAEDNGFSELMYKDKHNIEIFDPIYNEDVLINELKLRIDNNKRPKIERKNVGEYIYKRIMQ